MHAHVCTPSLVFYHLGCSFAGYSKPRGRETEPLPTLSSRTIIVSSYARSHIARTTRIGPSSIQLPILCTFNNAGRHDESEAVPMAAQRRGSHLLTLDATMKFQISILELRLPLESKTAAYLLRKDSPRSSLVSELNNSTFDAPLQRGIYYHLSTRLFDAIVCPPAAARGAESTRSSNPPCMIAPKLTGPRRREIISFADY